MKRIMFVVLAVLPAIVSCNQSGEVKVMSYNIRFDTPADGENAWDYRKSATIAMLE